MQSLHLCGTLGNRILHSRIASAARQPLEHGAPYMIVELAGLSGFEPDLHSFGDRPRIATRTSL